jgi:bifunctional UDP-N-acetylglucosamine pyrophosphorylase/glucosamine-1-phosphate N-acetyltransferase
VVLKNVTVGENAEIKTGSVAEDSEVGPNVKLGPYAHLRPESVVKNGAKIGNFVELKKAIVGEKTAISHLSYVGDAVVGSGVNIGCGFVTCNYDGRVIDGSRKHKTVIEDDVFIGSDCQVVAPITIRKNSFIASGSTINQEVPEDALAIARSRQVNKLGYAKKLK